MCAACVLVKLKFFAHRLFFSYLEHLRAAPVLCVQTRRVDAEVKTDGLSVCDFVPLCVPTVKKAKLDGPQGKTWDPGNRKRPVM